MSLEIKQGNAVNIETIPATYEDWTLSITKTSGTDGALKNIIINGHKSEDEMRNLRIEKNYESDSPENVQITGYDADLLSAIMDLVNGEQEDE